MAFSKASLVLPYRGDPNFKDGLSTLDVDGARFKRALRVTGYPIGKIVADIGSYPGTGYEFFGADNTYKAYGLIEGEYAERLHQRAIYFEHADIQTMLDFSTDADLVLFQEIIEHIRTPKKCLLKIYQGMKPGSLLYITTNNCFYFGYITKLILGRPILDPIDTEDAGYPGHHRYYSYQELRVFFEAHGAEVLVARRFNFMPPAFCYRKEWLGRLKIALAALSPNLYASHIELLIKKP